MTDLWGSCHFQNDFSEIKACWKGGGCAPGGCPGAWRERERREREARERGERERVNKAGTSPVPSTPPHTPGYTVAGGQVAYPAAALQLGHPLPEARPLLVRLDGVCHLVLGAGFRVKGCRICGWGVRV